MTTATTTSTLSVDPRNRSVPLSRWFKWIVPICIGASIVGAAGLHWLRRAPEPLVRYETVAVDRGPIAASVTATGTVSALVTVLVGSQVSGRIDALYADFESPVTKGQKIAAIEPTFFRAAVLQAKANFVSAEAAVDRARAHVVQSEKDLTRAKALLAEGIVSRAEFDAADATALAANADETAARAGVSQARAALEQAELNLRYTTIVSPIDGIVISRNVDVGQTVAAALQAPTLFTIAQDLTRMQVDTNVAEADVGKIRAGMSVSFTVDAHPTRSFNGVVRQVRDNATTIQNVVTYDAVIDVDNSERLLKPGMTASVTFVYATREDTLRLPNAALRFRPDPAVLSAIHASPGQTRPDERTIWILRGDRPSAQVVRTGIADNASTEVITEALHPGDRVVIEAELAGATKRGP
jgi:HlyD family secretion protein